MKYESPYIDWRLEIIAIRINGPSWKVWRENIIEIRVPMVPLLIRYLCFELVLSSASSLLGRMGFHHGWIRITIVSTVPRWSYHRPSTHSAVWNGDDNDDADATVSLITGRSTRGEMPPIIGATPLKQSNRTVRTLERDRNGMNSIFDIFIIFRDTFGSSRNSSFERDVRLGEKNEALDVPESMVDFQNVSDDFSMSPFLRETFDVIVQ
ncbi:hypothetical protein V1478_012856 [Vespula squamosa]|uniref:Uncharacterized protein n=1 Tax=Vespula squamosa TaxID=30214 RepID=A0ABD2A9T5_VESSQ